MQELIHNRLKIILNLEILQGLQKLNCILTKKKLAKSLFVAQLEMESEVEIPPDLSQSNLPSSFRFYDAIIIIAQN